MNAQSSSLRTLRRGILFAALPIGLIACGSSSSAPPPKAAAPATATPAPAIGGGPSAMTMEMGQAAPLLGSVTQAVPGLSTSQAATGVGSLLGLAQAKLPADQ